MMLKLYATITGRYQAANGEGSSNIGSNGSGSNVLDKDVYKRQGRASRSGDTEKTDAAETEHNAHKALKRAVYRPEKKISHRLGKHLCGYGASRPRYIYFARNLYRQLSRQRTHTVQRRKRKFIRRRSAQADTPSLKLKCLANSLSMLARRL